jgi:signal transduction histidine kinase
MAREIHDTLAQGFTGILVQLQAAEIVLTRSPEKALSFISRARELARESLGDARRSVWALRTHVLDSGSLADALGHLLDSMVAGTSIRSDFRVEGEPITLSPTIQAGFLRIGQEAMTNVVRYAEATQLVIALEFRSDQVSLSVRDDGKGFTMGDRPRGSGFGLIGMRERAVEIGAILLIDTRVGSGTEVRVTVAYGT